MKNQDGSFISDKEWLENLRTTSKKVKYYIEEDLGIDYRDAGPWRSYELTAGGDTQAELIEDATISETDQDGGELDCYGFEDASNEVQEAVLKLIMETIQ